MKYLRLFADGQGESHFEEIEAELEPVTYAPPAPSFDVSAPMDATRYVFVRMPSGWSGDMHCTPRRQLFCVMAGEIEGTASDGTARTLDPGGMLVMEDTEGKGHATRVTSPEDVLAVMVHLE